MDKPEELMKAFDIGGQIFSNEGRRSMGEEYVKKIKKMEADARFVSGLSVNEVLPPSNVKDLFEEHQEHNQVEEKVAHDEL